MRTSDLLSCPFNCRQRLQKICSPDSWPTIYLLNKNMVISIWLCHPSFKAPHMQMKKKCYRKNRSLVKEWDALSGNWDMRLDAEQEVSRQWAIEKGTQKERPRVSAPGWTSLTQNSLSCYCVSQYFCSFSGETGGLFIGATCGVKACHRFAWKSAKQRWPTYLPQSHFFDLFRRLETILLHHIIYVWHLISLVPWQAADII